MIKTKLAIPFIFLFLLTLPFVGEAKEKTYGNLIVSELVSVYDGDTFTVNLKGLHPIIGESIRIRLLGVDTPEIRDPNPKVKQLALQAREFTKSALLSAHTIYLMDIRRDKYFRIVADVYLDDCRLSELLIDAGLGKPYDGTGPRPQWDVE